MAYNQTSLTQKPHVISAKIRTTDLPFIGESSQQSVPIRLQDYVNVFVMNESGEVLVLEGNDNGRSWSSWQMVGRDLKLDEDPMLVAQQDLLLRTGYVCKNWTYLGTYVIDESQKAGAGYFFCAKLHKKIQTPDKTHTQNLELRWVPPREIKQALVDGRIAVINHAVAVSLAMVMCSHNE